ncbi:hypothetical protein OIU79_031024 [Salix purpurea]|uniref:Uncharacterized protein n=3 Tax=Salix TaxID=40685 RepID=A0A9Q0ZS01_SALPP|nr:hypothetical protein OIU79_031024 [Salix purpurea]
MNAILLWHKKKTSLYSDEPKAIWKRLGRGKWREACSRLAAMQWAWLPKEWDEIKKEPWNLWEDMFLRSAERWLRVMEVDVPDLKDDSMDDDANEDGLDVSNGVDSVAGGSPVLVLASRLHTGQKVLHVVSQESTQKAWNSAQGLRIYDSVNGD